MFCPSCGGNVPSISRFCPNCGAPAPAAPPGFPPGSPMPGGNLGMAPGPPGYPAPKKKSPVLKIFLIIAVVVFLLVVGFVAAMFFIVRGAIKNSDAYKVAIQTLRQSPAAADALGEIKEFGFPMGSISTNAGGSGQASFSMSVTGTKTSGHYYATLIRVNGQWRFVSGRLELDSGRSIDIGSPVHIEIGRLKPHSAHYERSVLAAAALSIFRPLIPAKVN